MFLREKSNSVRRWWRGGGCKFLEAQWRRLAFGCIVGSLIGTGAHLATRDSRFAVFFHQKWANLAVRSRFDGFRAYEPELLALCIGVFAIAVVPALLWLSRYVRAWWAGIASITLLLAACATLAALTFGHNYRKATT